MRPLAPLNTKKAREERTQRRKNIARAIELTWNALRTHLADGVTVPSEHGELRGNEEWNARCVREYGEILYTLSVELHELTKTDFKVLYEDLQKAIPP